MRHRAVFWIAGVIGALVLLALYHLFSVPAGPRRSLAEIDYSSLIANIDGDKVDTVTFSGTDVIVRGKDGWLLRTRLPHAQVIPALTDRLLAKGITVSAAPAEEEVPAALSILASWSPAILFYVLLYFAFARPLLRVARQLEALLKQMPAQTPRPPSSSA